MTVNIRYQPWLLVALFVSLVTCGCTANSETWERIESEGVLRVGLDPTYPPFAITTEDNLAGFDVDLAGALAEELDLQAEFVLFGYDGLYDALATEQVDVLISALVITPGRMRDFAYSEPYFNAGEILIIPEDSSDISAMDDLASHVLAVELGAQGHVEATQWAKQLAGLTIVPYTSADEALAAVSSAQADAALVDSISGRLYLAGQSPEQRTLRRIPDPVTVEPFAMVVRIEDETLLQNLNEALASLSSTGQLDQINQRWLDG